MIAVIASRRTTMAQCNTAFFASLTDPSLESTRLNQSPQTAVFPDGKRFLFVGNAARPEIHELNVVLNMFENLTARVPTK